MSPCSGVSKLSFLQIQSFFQSMVSGSGKQPKSGKLPRDRNFLLNWLYLCPAYLLIIHPWDLLIFFLIYLHFWLCWVFVAMQGLYLVTVKQRLLPSWQHEASHCSSLSCCGARAPGCMSFGSYGSRVQLSSGTWGSSRTGGLGGVPCTASWILSLVLEIFWW